MLLFRPCLCGKVMSAHKPVFSNAFWENPGRFPILLQWESGKENCAYPEGEGMEQQHPGGPCDRLPASFVRALWLIWFFWKWKTLSQPYYTETFQRSLPGYSVLQASSEESIQARQDVSWLAAIFTHVNHVARDLELSLSCALNGRLQMQIRLLIVCGYGQGNPSVNFRLHNSQTCSSVWVFSGEQKLSSGSGGPADILSG